MLDKIKYNFEWKKNQKYASKIALIRRWNREKEYGQDLKIKEFVFILYKKQIDLIKMSKFEKVFTEQHKFHATNGLIDTTSTMLKTQR